MDDLHQLSAVYKTKLSTRIERHLERARAELQHAVDASGVGSEASFAERERTMLELCNEIGRRNIRDELQAVADSHAAEFLLIDDVYYRRHQEGGALYHSLCGSVQIRRPTYRKDGVRNGPTVVPLELAAGLVERATPALAYRAALGDAQCPGRQWEQQMHASCRVPPSRSTLERIAKAIGDKAKKVSVEIETIIRSAEKLPPGVCAIAVGLDRTTIPMEELRSADARPDPCRRRRRTEYVRRKPPRIDVNYRMAYVGTVSFMDKHGEAITTFRYAASANEGPQEVLAKMMADVRHAQEQRKCLRRPPLQVGIIQDAAAELWGLLEGALEKDAKVTAWLAGVDRFHVTERLAEVLSLLPLQKVERERRLEQWRQELETDDGTIDRVERYLQKQFRQYDANCKKHGRRPSFGDARKVIDHLGYIKNHKHKMRYATLRAACLPTGSGATEGACKSLVMTRTKRCGQRWHERGVNAVLTLRAYHMSERLPAAWRVLSFRYTAEIREAA